MDNKFREREKIVDKKKLVVKLMEDGKKASLAAKMNIKKFERINRLSDY